MKFACVVLLTIMSLGCGYGMHNYGMTNGGSVQVTQFVPQEVTAGSPAFMLTVNGSGFTMNSVVFWNGMPLSTQFLTPGQVVATVPASLIATPETITVYVNSNGTASNMMNFTVN